MVARVMHGVGTPQLLMSPGVSPHLQAMHAPEVKALRGRTW